MEYAPVLVENHDATVTFKCHQATPLDLIRATGRQTRIPIGVVLGKDPSLLSKPRRYDLEKVTARDALLEAIRSTDYSIREEGGVLELIAGDLAPRQNGLLLLHYSNFKLGGTLVEMGVFLTGWMWAVIRPGLGFMTSIAGSTNDEQFSGEAIPSATTEEIANKIVSLGSKGMWILRTSPDLTNDPSNDKVEIEPYQHYSNRANVDF
jgi:hypothetical protein